MREKTPEKNLLIKQEPNNQELINNFRSDAKVTFMRHGSPHYSDEELATADFEGTLEEKGREQVKSSALKIAAEAKENNEIIIVYSSPRQRADQTAEILVQTLESSGVSVLNRNKSSEDLKHQSLKSLSAPEVTKEFWDKKPQDEFMVKIWRELFEQGELPDGVETPPAAEAKLKRVLNFNANIINVFKKYLEIKQKIRIINVGHFETVTPILQAAYGGEAGIDKDKGLAEAEYLNVDMQTLTNNPDLKAVLHLSFPKAANGGFDKQAERYLTFSKNRELTNIDQ